MPPLGSKPKPVRLVSTCMSLRLFLHNVQAIFFSFQSCHRHMCAYTQSHINIYVSSYICSVESNVTLTHCHWINNWMWNMIIFAEKVHFSRWVTGMELELFSFSNICWPSTEQFLFGRGKPSVFGKSNNCYTLLLSWNVMWNTFNLQWGFICLLTNAFLDMWCHRSCR